MAVVQLRQPGFMYKASGQFSKIEEWLQKFKATRNSRYIYQNEVLKASFQDDMAYGDFKDLLRRTTSDKVLHDKAFNIKKNSNYDGCLRGLASMLLHA